jgi:UDP-2,3-diacylglucosamine pyrophosphatase LpxH
MPTFCISDLHLCDRGPRDNFAYNGREGRFFDFLDFVAASQGRLIVLGDLFDWWQVNVSDSVLAYLPLIDRLAAMNATYVVGNHDCALTKFIGNVLMPAHPIFQRCRRAFEETIGSRRFAFLHGHEADPYCRDMNPGTGEITAIISGILEDRNKGPFRRGHAVEDEFVGTLESALTIWRTLTFQHGRLAEMIDGVEAYRREAGAQVVVYGHTHEPGQIGNHHFNTGCWARQQDTFVRIEDNSTASVWQWEEGGPTPYEHSLK